jgi:tetratricopeptide (TPR) repeat protein
MTDVVERRAQSARPRTPGRQAEPAAAVAARALDLVGEDPGAAIALAGEALVLARRQRDGAATTTALRAQGLAARATGDLAVAEEKLRRAVRLALRRGDDHSAAEARMTLSFVLLDAGKVRSALRQSGLASTVLDGVDGARLLAQHGLILQRCGRTDAALEAYATSLDVVRAHGDVVWESRICSNRGILYAYHGQSSAAEHDLLRARSIELSLGRTLDAAISTWNLGFVAARAGDAVKSLGLYDEGDAVLGPLGSATAQRLMDRAEVVLSVGLSHEAHRLAAAAMAELGTSGQGADMVECGLLLARAALLDGRPHDAAEAARAARRRAIRQQRPSWGLLARHLEVRALEDAGQHGAGLLRRAEQLAEALDRARWPEAAAEARLTAARVAIRLGRSARAAAILAPIVQGRSTVLTREVQIQRWHALAMLRQQDGDLPGALRAARRALVEHERRRAAVAATDLQLSVGATGLPIAQLAVQLAVHAGSPAAVLASLEIWRSQNLRTRPVRPPRDDDQSRALERLRRATSDVMTARLAGEDATSLVLELSRAEREVIDRNRLVRPGGGGPRRQRADARLSEIRAELGGATLVELFAVGDRVGAATTTGGSGRRSGASVTELGSLQACLHEVDHLQFALGRLASGRGSDAMLAAARASAERSVASLDDLLFGPLRSFVRGRPVVLVPSDGLHAVPWALLPALQDGPVHLGPSATAWVAAKRRFTGWAGGSADRILVATWPGLEHAEREAAAIAQGRSRVRILAGRRATVARVRDALQATRTAHIAAHGRFESDNPMMSSLQLSDGPLMVYDLEELSPPPLQVVLAACHSATARLHAGHELLGLAHALLWFGSSGVVATNLPAPDAETAVLMRGLHHGLAAGQGVAEALWAARTTFDTSTPAGYATAAGFHAYGY